jgi:hypothetical protein
MPIVPGNQTVVNTTPLTSLVERVRRYMRDWPAKNYLAFSCSSTDTVLQLQTQSTEVLAENDYIEIGTETMRVVKQVGQNVTVMRGMMGTDPQGHGFADPVLYKPKYYSIEIQEALADAIDAAYPWIFRFVESDILLGNTYIYDFPYDSETGVQFTSIYGMELAYPGWTWTKPVTNWRVLPPSKIHIVALNSGATITVYGTSPFPRLTNTQTLDPQWPQNLEYPLVEYAANYLLASGEILTINEGETTSNTETQTTQHGEVIATQHGEVIAEQHGEVIADLHGQSIVTTPATTETVTHNETQNKTTTDTKNFDGGSETVNETGTTIGGTDVTAMTGTSTEAHSGTDTETHSGTDTQTHSGTDTETHSGSDIVTVDGSQSITRVGANAQMMQSALSRYMQRVQNSGYPPMPRRFSFR